MNFGLEWQIKEEKHQSFIDGRVGAAIVNRRKVGIVGEIHPKVLEAWKLENPAAAFELNIGGIVKRWTKGWRGDKNCLKAKI